MAGTVTTVEAPRIAPERILPVVVIDRATDAVPLAEALLRGGISAVEVTLRTPAALDALAAMCTVDGLVVGAGTVRSREQAVAAVDAGATFLVSPGLDVDVARTAQELDVPLVPGVATATEVQHATTLGLHLLKVFPAATLGGADHVRALAAPFPEVRFVPSGGITPTSARSYLDVAAVDAVCGSWMVDRGLLERGDWAEVARLARAAVEAAR
jgi:2-dehydro-3-deoxyphosphogluconate aldolase/(4S)-4-hydroxy-2-oxoglutarate aldolase